MDYLFQKQEEEKFLNQTMSQQLFLDEHDELQKKQLHELMPDITQKQPETIGNDAPEYNPKEKRKDKKIRLAQEKQHFTEKARHVTPSTVLVTSIYGLRRMDERLPQEFDQSLNFEMFSPKYVFAHYDEVVNKLHRYKALLELHERGADPETAERLGNMLSDEQKLRIPTMRMRFEAGKKAFISAMRALGYVCDENNFNIVGELSNKERDAALEKNREDREDIRLLSKLDEDDAVKLERRIVDAHKEELANAVEIAVSDEEEWLMECREEALQRASREESPNPYDEHGDALEKMEADILRLRRLLASQQENDECLRRELERQRTEECSFKESLSAGMMERLEKRLAESSAKTELLSRYISSMKNTMTTFLIGDELLEEQRLILNKYKGDEQLERNVAAYAQVYNADVQEDITTCVEEVKKFDSKLLKDCEPDQLIAQAEGLATLYRRSEKVMDFLKEGGSEEYASWKSVAVLKHKLIKHYAHKARQLALAKAYSEGYLKQEYFTQEEQRDIRKKFGIAKETEIGANQLYAYFRKQMVRDESLIDEAYNGYYHSEETKAKYILKAREGETTTHLETYSEMQEAMAFVRQMFPEEIKEEKNITEKHIKTAYKALKEKLEELSEGTNVAPNYATMGRHGTVNGMMEATEINRRMACLEMYYALHHRGSYITLDNQRGLGEPLLRSFSVFDGVPAIQNMSEKDYFEMLRKLSAGALESEGATPEEVESFRRENKEGLMLYKERMREHYEMLENLLHHQEPSLEEIEENREKLRGYFMPTQVDMHFLERFPEMIDMKNPEDAYLYHLVRAHQTIGYYIDIVGTNIAQMEMDYREGIQFSKGAIDSDTVKESFAYLDRKASGQM